MRIITTFLIGLVFGTGLTFGGMVNPTKVINFFDVAGDWDPSLLLVMVSALAVTAIGFHFVLKRPKPLFEDGFSIPGARNIDTPLIAGSATFGVGWGIAGFCPGGAVVALGLAVPDPIVFVLAMLVGIATARYLMYARRARRQD